VSYESALREVYKNYDPKKSEAKKLAKHIKKNFTEEKIYKAICDATFGKEIEEYKNEIDTLLENLL